MVGVVANTDEILGEEASKGAHFLNMCDRRDIPLIFLQNSLPSTPSHHSDAGGGVDILKSRAAMCATLATLSVPTISLTLSSCTQQDHLLMVISNIHPSPHPLYKLCCLFSVWSLV
jgi:acetyl-CoA carboxylase carboxyltransferase component